MALYTVIPESTRILPFRPTMAEDIEYIAKTCTAKQASGDPDVALAFLEKLALAGHEAVLEHRRITVLCDVADLRSELAYHGHDHALTDFYHLVAGAIYTGPGSRYLSVTRSVVYSRSIIEVQGNLHAWRDYIREQGVCLFGMNSPEGVVYRYLLFAFLNCNHADIITSVSDAIPAVMGGPDVDRSGLVYTKCTPSIRYTDDTTYCSVELEVSRGVADELARHRIALCLESTRWCRYKNGIAVVSPADAFGWNLPGWRNCLKRWIWACAMGSTSLAYNLLLRLKCSPQEARSVLTLSTKTRMVMTATIAEWTKIIRLRTAADAHPQARSIANQTKTLLQVNGFLPPNSKIQ